MHSERPDPTVPPDPRAAGRALGGSDALGRSLARWAAEARVDDAARHRARQRWLRIQAEEEATLLGALVDLAERARPVVIDVGTHRIRGRLAGIGADFVALRSDADHDVLVRTAGVEVIRAEPGEPDLIGERSAVIEASLAGVLGPLATERPDVLVRTRSGATVRGELRSAGTDVVRIRADGDPPVPTWVPIDAVDVLVLNP